MSHHAHDMRLFPFFVDGVFHGLAIHRQRIVLRAPCPVPSVERTIQSIRFNAHQAIADDEFAGDDID